MRAGSTLKDLAIAQKILKILRLGRHPIRRNRTRQLAPIGVPAEILGWNWGAFWLGPFWSWGNRVWGRLFWWMVLVTISFPIWIAFSRLEEAGLVSEELCAVLALASLCMSLSHFIFYPVAILCLGATGNQRAWRTNRWHTVDEFNRGQRWWAIAGWIFGIPVLVFNLWVVGVLLSLFGVHYITLYR